MIKTVDTTEDKASLTAEIIFIALVTCSVFIRMVNIASPLLEAHAFRQTQTAITIWTFVKEGIDFFSYQTPVFGPPWQAPFEFPLFQAAAALIVKAGVSNIDTAARMTNIMFFYLSAFFLFVLCGRFFREQGITYTIVLCYVLSPYTIFWSRTSMIDYASVAFALGYFYFFLHLLDDTDGLFTLSGTVVFGALGYLVKITTMPVVVFPLAYFIVKQLWSKHRAGSGLLSFIYREKRFLIKLIIAIVVPVGIGCLWTIHADNIKNASLFTKWLTSEYLEGWNYGTWSQRAQINIWITIFRHIIQFLPLTFVLIPVGLAFVLKHPRRYIEFIYTGIIGTVLTIFIFFNLYKAHNYYPMAVTPFLATVVGFAIYHIFSILLVKKTAALLLKRCLAAACIVLLGYLYVNTAKTYLKSPLITNKYSSSTISDFLKIITQPDEYIIITDHLWNPSILYYARRKGFMINKDYDYGARLLAFFKEHNFTTVVTVHDYPELLSNWRYVLKIAPHRIIGLNIYKVTDDPQVFEDYKKLNDIKIS
uniref:Glycosyl transferase family protein n=1 Tax=uncultured Nitrospirae bacterium MY2-1F TaxID=798576 RepID=D9MNY5_9BACT|nr:glycosyl transferase family protein [uncultured Nitrospirae bacterium MY2-1F]